MKDLANEIENYMVAQLTLDQPNYEKRVYEAMTYSLMAGGKRLRPIILLKTGQMLGLERNKLMPYACAIEMIHTYSLIHDDLPAMDDDDLRRGKPTCHKAFDEATAILAGDGLLTKAFEVMGQAALDNLVEPIGAVRALTLLSQAAGTKGMIAGQTVDMMMEQKPMTSEILDYIHRTKTTALLMAAFQMPAVLINDLEEGIYISLSIIGEHLGMAFQIQDDLLDVLSTEEVLGKPVLSDRKNEKKTYVDLYGIDACREKVKEHFAEIDQVFNTLKGMKSVELSVLLELEALIAYIRDRKM